MKNYEKYLDGILLITWSPPYIGNTSLTVMPLICSHLWCSWFSRLIGLPVAPPCVTAPFKKVLYFSLLVSLQGVAGRGYLTCFKSLKAEM